MSTNKWVYGIPIMFTSTKVGALLSSNVAFPAEALYDMRFVSQILSDFILKQ